jgi:hypothetical protein
MALTWRMVYPLHPHHLQGGAAPAPGASFIIASPALQGATSGLVELRELSAPYATSGWLLHVLCNKGIKEGYDAAHNSVVDAFKVCVSVASWIVRSLRRHIASLCCSIETPAIVRRV